MNAPLKPAEARCALAAFTDEAWDTRIVPALTDYIAVPAKSPMFDAQWAENGLLDRVVRDAAAWVESRRVAGLTLEVVRLEGRTPVIFFDIPATKAGSADTRAAFTAISTNNLNSTAGAATWDPGRRSTKTACSTAVAVPMTGMRSTPPSAPSRRWTSRASRGRVAWA